ncbi:MAG: class A beta-lactamase-related serine hydrolase [Dehalococcoidia bacterium]|nr:MAG: class A beta-lactamase-related serine hydrolase [Dehalococcoidia bacterium]
MGVVQGTVEPGFEAVRELLEQQFTQGEHIGAGVSVYHRGQPVVDIWGGLANEETKTPWERDTMALSFSTTKGLTSTCLHILADRDLVDYGAPVAKYWPEFAQAGKADISVYHLLTHQAGLAPIPEPLHGGDLLDWERVIHALETMAPVWEPGAETGYHAVTFGFLVGEVVRRVSGKRIGAFLRDEVCAPLGLDDMHIGTTAAVEPRIAKLKNRMVIPPDMMKQIAERAAAGQPMVSELTLRALGMKPGQLPTDQEDHVFDTPAGHQAEVPAANGIMTARDLAKMYACLGNFGELDGARILSEERVRIMSEQQTFRPDKVIMFEIPYALGYMTGGVDGWPQGPRVSAFGHAGLGGSIGYCDPEIEMAFGFTTNALSMDLVGYGRTAALATAARTCAERVAERSEV